MPKGKLTKSDSFPGTPLGVAKGKWTQLIILPLQIIQSYKRYSQSLEGTARRDEHFGGL